MSCQILKLISYSSMKVVYDELHSRVNSADLIHSLFYYNKKLDLKLLDFIFKIKLIRSSSNEIVLSDTF